MKESQFKKRILLLLSIAKFTTLITLWFEWHTNGFSTSEFIASISVILPLFTVYSTIVLKDLSGNIFEESIIIEDKLIKKIIVQIANISIILYGLLISAIIVLKPKGILSFSDMQATISILESIFGVYIGNIIFTIFKEKK